MKSSELTFDQAVERAYTAIERAAIAGARCPPNYVDGVRTDMVLALAGAGRIRVEISGYNYRTVVLLEGRHAGKSTRPGPGRVWKIIDRDGTRSIRCDGSVRWARTNACGRRPGVSS